LLLGTAVGFLVCLVAAPLASAAARPGIEVADRPVPTGTESLPISTGAQDPSSARLSGSPVPFDSAGSHPFRLVVSDPTRTFTDEQLLSLSKIFEAMLGNCTDPLTQKALGCQPSRGASSGVGVGLSSTTQVDRSMNFWESACSQKRIRGHATRVFDGPDTSLREQFLDSWVQSTRDVTATQGIEAGALYATSSQAFVAPTMFVLSVADDLVATYTMVTTGDPRKGPLSIAAYAWTAEGLGQTDKFAHPGGSGTNNGTSAAPDKDGEDEGNSNASEDSREPSEGEHAIDTDGDGVVDSSGGDMSDSSQPVVGDDGAGFDLWLDKYCQEKHRISYNERCKDLDHAQDCADGAVEIECSDPAESHGPTPDRSGKGPVRANCDTTTTDDDTAAAANRRPCGPLETPGPNGTCTQRPNGRRQEPPLSSSVPKMPCDPRVCTPIHADGAQKAPGTAAAAPKSIPGSTSSGSPHQTTEPASPSAMPGAPRPGLPTSRLPKPGLPKASLTTALPTSARVG